MSKVPKSILKSAGGLISGTKKAPPIKTAGALNGIPLSGQYDITIRLNNFFSALGSFVPLTSSHSKVVLQGGPTVSFPLQLMHHGFLGPGILLGSAEEIQCFGKMEIEAGDTIVGPVEFHGMGNCPRDGSFFSIAFSLWPTPIGGTISGDRSAE
jgi:hypothetical protein